MKATEVVAGRMKAYKSEQVGHDLTGLNPASTASFT
jgi:hypothetical protein